MNRLKPLSRTLVLLSFLTLPPVQAATNEGGFALTSLSSERYSAGGGTISDGNQSAWVGQSSGSSFSTSLSGYRVSVGVGLPGKISPTPTASLTPTLNLTSTQTPTETPTATPTGPTQTEPPCTIASNIDSFDLFKDDRIDSRDLLLWLDTRRGENGVDFNCDSEVNSLDLIQFSIHWKSSAMEN